MWEKQTGVSERISLTNSLVKEIIEKAKKKSYWLTARDLTFLIYLFNRYKIESLKNINILKTAFEAYDVNDYLNLWHTASKIFVDLKIVNNKKSKI